MSDRTDDKRPDEDEPADPSKAKPAEAPPVTGPNAPAVGDGKADKTDDNRKGGYGTG